MFFMILHHNITRQCELLSFKNSSYQIPNPDLMKNFCFGLLFLILSLSGAAQPDIDRPAARVFQRLVIDIGAAPVAFSNPGRFEHYFYNFAIGYQFRNHFALKFHYDLIHAMETVDNPPWGGSFTSFERMFAMGIGGNYRFYPQKPQGLFKGVSYSAALKAGATFSHDYSEQQSVFYDVSVRIYPKKNFYFAAGFNHDLFTDRMRWSPDKEHLQTFYFSFGLDF